MSAALAPEVTPTHVFEADDKPGHVFCCCSPRLGLCGADLTGDDICPHEGACDCVGCVVCVDLQDITCQRCRIPDDAPFCWCGGCA